MFILVVRIETATLYMVKAQLYLHIPSALKLNNAELCYTACYVIRIIHKAINKYVSQHHYRVIFVMGKHIVFTAVEDV
jgi:hypothetical protein